MSPQMIRLPVGVAASRETYTALLTEKRRCLETLCEAAKAYLCVEIDAELTELAKPFEPPNMVGEALHYRPDAYQWCPTLEDLAKAQEAVQNLELQMEKLEDMHDSEIGKLMGPMIDGMYGPMLQRQLEEATRTRDALQKRMEEVAAAKEPE